MVISLNRAQMLERRRIAAGLEPLRSDCAIGFSDGIDIDSELAQDMRRRYLELLDNGDERYLLAEPVECKVYQGECCGASMVAIDDMCRRVHDVQLDSWNRAVRVLGPEAYDDVLMRQLNCYLAATADRPVAVMTASGDIASWPAGRDAKVRGYLDHGDDVYLMDEAALAVLCD